MITSIIKNWNSEAFPLDRPYLIVNELIKYYNKMSNNNLINLYHIDKKYNNFCWFIDTNKGQIYNINLYIDNNPYEDKFVIKNILEELKCNIYMKLNFFVTTLKRSQIFNKKKIPTSIIINVCIKDKNPEYFELADIKMEELSINKQSRKRKNSETFDKVEDPSKLKKKIKIIDDINWTEMISASSVRNFFLNDTIIDWLKEYNITSIKDIPTCKQGTSKGIIKYEVADTFTKFIMEQGVFFEEKIVEIINKKHSIIKVAESYESKNIELFKKTKNIMKEGCPIIYQGILHNYNNQTYGAPDLMIRNDYLNKFIGYDLYNDTSPSNKLGVPWHYVIVDIKHSIITLNSDGIHIRNQDSIPAYKGQLLIYTQALNEIQGTNISKAFILGKKYIYENKGTKFEINNLMNKLGVIDYSNVDKLYVQKLDEALKWLRSVRKEGHNWKLLPIPSKNELFPNMKNDKDGAFNKIKRSLAEEINEITSVTYCGIEKRKLAFTKGIYGWNDENCTSKNLGFKDGPLAKRIDAILEINRQNQIYVKPSKINFEEIQWRNRKINEMEFFLDYETINSNFGDININGENNMFFQGCNFIFMIGVGFINKENKWEFKSFVLEYKTKESERNMLNNFWIFINNKLKEYNKTESVFVHWSQAEKIVYEKTQLRHLNLQNKKLIDLYEVFIKEPIVVKGALNYSLKTITKALYKNNLIKTTWNTSNPCSNGLNAMLLAYKCYEKNEKVTNDILTIKNIEEYNEIDCKSIWEIIEYLRNNH